MFEQAIIITGTSGSGKSSIAKEIITEFEQFQIVTAITTRSKRDDDKDNQYRYLNQQEFEREHKIVRTEYRGKFYGISENDVLKVEKKDKIPILVITPSSVKEASKNFEEFISVFLDSSDEILDSRLDKRDGKLTLNKDKIYKQRSIDRYYSFESIYRIYNNDQELFDLANFIKFLWQNRLKSSVLTSNWIKKFIAFGVLMKNAENKNVSNASYDLRLGDEYYCDGKINKLSEHKPFVMIESYDYAIVTSQEIMNLPNDVAGRFDLSVGIFCQGIILSNGPQIDPGFNGRLFCLLFNTSNSPVVIKRGQHYATIEFTKLIEPTEGYTGQYQGKSGIEHYLPSNTLQKGVSFLKSEIENIKNENKTLQNVFYAVISLILAVIALLIVLQ